MNHVCPACQNEPGAECLACAFTCEACDQELTPADLAYIIALALNPETADDAHGALLTAMEAGSGGFDVSVEGDELTLRVGGLTFTITVGSRSR